MRSIGAGIVLPGTYASELAEVQRTVVKLASLHFRKPVAFLLTPTSHYEWTQGCHRI